MKLEELATTKPSAKMAKTFEGYFGGNVDLNRLTHRQTRQMFHRVKDLLSEHRSTSKIHTSEQNPNYMKLVMLESMLRTRLKELDSPATTLGNNNTDIADVVKGATKAATAVGAQGKGQTIGQALDSMAKNKAMSPTQKATMSKLGQGLQTIIADPVQSSRLQQMLKTGSAKTFESTLRKRFRLTESEVQQAQVVLAAQDMVTRVQKMLEDVTEMQFKELPALVDQIKNQIGADQSAQFNTDSTNALQQLVASIQTSKQQLEAALGVVTGQQPVMPGDAGMAPPPGADGLGGDAALAGALPGEEDDIEVDADAELDVAEPPDTSVGRKRR